MAQLAAVGEELKAARGRIAALEAAHMGAKDEAALKYIRREALFLVPRLMDLLPPGERFVIVDAGARDGEDDPRWRPFPPHRLAIFGFEPDQAEAARLNELARKNGHERRVHAAGLWRTSGCLLFHHNKASGGGSFLPQNREITDRWKFENPTATSPAREVFVATHTEPLRVTSLKEWASEAGLTEIDFVKLNVQGAELQVLEGAAGLLDGVLGILVEVSFVESYRGRPLFADIDAHLRGAGFTFFDLLAHHYVGRAVAPVAAQHLALVQPTLGQQVSAWGQLVEGHALYLRDPLTPDAGSPDVRRCLKLAALAEACGQIEFAFEVLGWLVRRADVASRDLASQLRQACVDGAEDYRRHLAVREAALIRESTGSSLRERGNMGDRLLTIEEYDARERDARAKASYPAIRAFSPRAFNDVNFPARVSKEEELRRYADIMYELLARTPLLEHPLYSETEARAISRLSDQIRTLTVERFGRPVRPLMCLFAPMALLRTIETMAAMRQRRLRVYEIGPGSGYLGAYLLNAGHRYAAMEVCQALYLWQNRLMAAIAADFSEGARFEEPPPCFAHQATHVPWWHFARLHEGQPEPADVVVCDAAMGEMDAFALPYVLRIARAMLATSDGGALLFQNVGEERFHSRAQVCSMLAALGFRHRTIGGVTVASCAGEPLPPGLSDLERLGGPSERVLAAREFLAIEESELLESYRFFDFIGSLPPYPVDLQAAPRRPDPATA